MKKIPFFLVTMLLGLVSLLSCSHGAGDATTKGLVGTVLAGPTPAPDFTLTDQHGRPFHLADTRGKVVVLTFLYTHCTDICPYLSLKVRGAHNLLGADVDKVVFVGVTTDPERDTVAVEAAYSRATGLFDVWHFLTGTPKELKDLWARYGIGVHVENAESNVQDPAPSSGLAEAPSPTQGLSAQDLDTAGTIISRFGGGYEVSHSAPFWIVDTTGNLRVVMDAAALPSDIVKDARLLLAAH
jgi:cytochrome oxidase Cu insertion factor (SCO1/SenC/PrrC family)